MSSGKAGQEQKDGSDGGAPAPAERPQPPNSRLQALVDEYRRNNAQTERREQTKDVWARAIAIGGLLTTALTAVLAVIGYRQFSLAQNQAQVQLRPYAAVTLDRVSAVAEGQKLTVAFHYDNVGNTPVYAATLHPFFAFITDNKVPLGKVAKCRGMSSRGSVFAKKQEWEEASDFTVNKSHLDLLKAGAGDILFFARLCYSDVFNEVNWTDLCIYWHTTDGEIRLNYCDNSHNQMVSGYAPGFGFGWLTRLLPATFR